jgi:hypothetical protein
MSTGSGRNNDIETRTVTGPPAFQQPFLQRGFEAAQQQILNRPTSFPPGTRVPPFSPETATALNLATTRALTGSPLQQAGLEHAQNVIGGGFTGLENPAYQAMVDRAVRPLTRQFEDVALPGVRGAFSRAGRGGSNIASATALGNVAEDYLSSVGDVSAQLAYPTYTQERATQDQFAAGAPQLAQADYSDIGRLRGVGAERERLLAAQAAEQAERFRYQQAEPPQRVSDYLRNVGGGGLGSTTVQLAGQQAPNPLLGLLGGAGIGAQLVPSGVSTFGGAAPYLAGGAALGGLSTLFG